MDVLSEIMKAQKKVVTENEVIGSLNERKVLNEMGTASYSVEFYHKDKPDDCIAIFPYYALNTLTSYGTTTVYKMKKRNWCQGVFSFDSNLSGIPSHLQVLSNETDYIQKAAILEDMLNSVVASLLSSMLAQSKAKQWNKPQDWFMEVKFTPSANKDIDNPNMRTVILARFEYNKEDKSFKVHSDVNDRLVNQIKNVNNMHNDLAAFV